MQAIYAARRERLRRAMRARGLDALLVSQAANRFYLSGFELHDPQCNESAGRLIVTADGRDWLATDARYLDAAARLWDQERIFIYGGDAAKDLHSLLRRCGGRVGLEARGVSLAFARALDQALGLKPPTAWWSTCAGSRSPAKSRRWNVLSPSITSSCNGWRVNWNRAGLKKN